MSFVHLRNLFEDDKNFYGLLDSNIEVVVREGEHFHLLTTESKKAHAPYLNKPIRISDLFDTAVGYPEWGLDESGELENYTWPCRPKGETKVITPILLKISISEWLSTLPKERVLKIADCEFNRWKNKEDGPELNLKYHPRWNTKGERRTDRVKQEPQWSEFVRRFAA